MYLVPMMWTSVKPGGTSAGGFPCVAPSVFACALPCDGVVSGDATAGVVDVALLSAGATDAGVDDAAALSVVDVAAGGASTTEGEEEATTLVDVSSTCARTGLTIVKPMRRANKSTIAPVNVMKFIFILLFLADKLIIVRRLRHLLSNIPYITCVRNL